MKRSVRAALLVLLGTLSSSPCRAVDMNMMLLFTGPVSEAVEQTVLLVRRGESFISPESLAIGCIAAGSAGLLVGVAPMLGLVATTAGAPVGLSYVAGVTLLSCGMAVAGSAVGMATFLALEAWRAPP